LIFKILKNCAATKDKIVGFMSQIGTCSIQHALHMHVFQQIRFRASLYKRREVVRKEISANRRPKNRKNQRMSLYTPKFLVQETKGEENDMDNTFVFRDNKNAHFQGLKILCQVHFKRWV
jgi:hypothetical protein